MRLKMYPERGKRPCKVNNGAGLYEDFSPFFIDSIKISRSKSLKRLESKTQVYTVPDNPHIRTRLVHTNEVVWISRLIAAKLGLNERLCEAVALGHDVGHTPYGHPGERMLEKIRPGFKHEKNSIVMLEFVEMQGKGVNACVETIGGILYHSRGGGQLFANKQVPQEWNVVMFADKLAYVFSDINDSERLGYLKKTPREAKLLGSGWQERLNTCIRALIKESKEMGYVSFSNSKEAHKFMALKDFMYDKIYRKIDGKMKTVYLEVIYEVLEKALPEFDPVLLTSMLTDQEATALANKLLDNPLNRRDVLLNRNITGLADLLDGIEEIPRIDYENVSVEWVMNRKRKRNN